MATLKTRTVWLVPLLFALAFAAASYSALTALKTQQRAQIESLVETTLATTLHALDIWRRENEAVVRLQVADPRVREAILTLLALSRTTSQPRESLLAAPEQKALRAIFEPVVREHHLTGWAAEDPSGLVLASSDEETIGIRRPAILRGRADEILHTPPVPFPLPDGGVSYLMITGAGVFDLEGTLQAYFGVSMDPRAEFAETLRVARLGETGETYAFDETGVIVSPSRFQDQLRGLGLLPKEGEVPDSDALRLEARDPGGDMTRGHEPANPLRARPFTKAAASALAGERSFDVDGYRDYRGVPVVGAWAWVPESGIGVVSEIDADEAYAGVEAVALRLYLLMALLALAAAGLGAYAIVVARLQGNVDKARHLGRYRVERKLGKGGMGTVYLARHALLRRPAALKVLESGAAGQEAVTRFEREVQTTSALSHPNTIEIYDFGHTPEGAFYYAMEYVGGFTLQQLVDSRGPLPEARVRHLLMQAAGSLAEAHRAGVIHRDLKPSNLMVCERGGVFDYLKVLDFGLVRMNQQPENLAITQTQAITGSPLYMSPEALERPRELDVRGDVYQLGAVAYFLLSGRPPFEGEDLIEVLAKHLNQQPESPSKGRGEPVSPALEALVMRCLEKDPEKRSPDAGALLGELTVCEVSGTWTQTDAESWWIEWAEAILAESADSEGSHSGGTPSGWSINLDTRLKSRKS